ncbi:hypothetical protein Agabi119p4_2622 [Agaricus bisporus var. burnettii]|uniref:Uncharacterized protein n=1 Tax=Agaricus bisporus var. burnettii TaxID=192524 RepID=A0A8H7F9D6_AGABI|nr:hypothetical protein Agabi119p4_2622 [Agaricus bisporus var. burnettii]
MNRFGKGLRNFFVSTKKKAETDVNSQDANELQNRRRQRNQVKQNKPRVDDGLSSSTRRRSLFKPFPLSTSKKDKARDQLDAPSRGGKSEKTSRDEIIQQHLHDIGRLSDNHTRLQVKIRAKEAEIENLRNEGRDAKWKDGLYEQRMKEHASAQASISTGSASEVDIMKLVKQLNSEIVAIATLATKAPARDTRSSSLETIPNLLGEKFSMSFKNSDNPLAMGLARALLQIFLVQRCETFIHSWCLGNPEFDVIFNKFYNRIYKKEEQRVAGKWRQITFGQLPHDHKAFQIEVASKLMDLSSCAGWEGDVQEISARMDVLFNLAAKIRKHVKEEIISADIQPWAAVSRAKFDSKDMKNVGEEFDLSQVANPTECTVLGCTELGLVIRLAAAGASSEMKNVKSRARVVLNESLGVGQPYASKL